MSIKISLIVPVKNEETHIEALIRSVLAQSSRPDELIFADAGSGDKTVAMIRRYSEEYQNSLPIRWLISEGALPGRGRNRAIEIARNDIIAMTDGGIVLDACWIEELAKPFESDPAVDVVYGMAGYMPETVFEKCLVMACRPRSICTVDGKGLFGPFLASMALRKSVWEEVGGFREDLRGREDNIFLDAVVDRNYKSVTTPKAIVYWRPWRNFRELFLLSSKYTECSIQTRYALGMILRKWSKLAVLGVLLILSIIDMKWFVLFAAAWIANICLRCRNHWRERKSDILHWKGFLYLFSIVFVDEIAVLYGSVKGVAKLARELFGVGMRENRPR